MKKSKQRRATRQTMRPMSQRAPTPLGFGYHRMEGDSLGPVDEREADDESLDELQRRMDGEREARRSGACELDDAAWDAREELAGARRLPTFDEYASLRAQLAPVLQRVLVHQEAACRAAHPLALGVWVFEYLWAVVVGPASGTAPLADAPGETGSRCHGISGQRLREIVLPAILTNGFSGYRSGGGRALDYAGAALHRHLGYDAWVRFIDTRVVMQVSGRVLGASFDEGDWPVDMLHPLHLCQRVLRERWTDDMTATVGTITGCGRLGGDIRALAKAPCPVMFMVDYCCAQQSQRLPDTALLEAGAGAGGRSRGTMQ